MENIRKPVVVVLVLVCACSCAGLKVDKVHFASGHAWAGVTPETVLCNVTLGTDEKVTEVNWDRDGELVYRWIKGESPEVFGVLEGRVETLMDTWSIKVVRMSMQLEGNYTCSVTSSNNVTDAASFRFIVFYAPNATSRNTVSEDDCSIGVTLTLPEVMPFPFVRCTLRHPSSGFNLTLAGNETRYKHPDDTHYLEYSVVAKFKDYPVGSELICSDSVYGDDVELVTWVPDEEPSCPELGPTRTGYNVSHRLVYPGCRSGVKIGSRVTYTCVNDNLIFFGATCENNGAWSVDLSKDKTWPNCNKGNLGVGSTSLLLLCLLFVSSFMVL